MSATTTKPTPQTTVARTAKYRTTNPSQNKLNRLKENVNKSQKRLTNKDYDEEIKLKQREKKRRQREEANNKKKNNPSSDFSPMDTSSTPSSSSTTRLVIKFPFSRGTRKTSGGTRDISPIRKVQDVSFEEEDLSMDSISTSPPGGTSLVSTSSGDSSTFSGLASSTPCSKRVPFQARNDLPEISRQSQLGQKIRRQNNKIKAVEIADLKVGLDNSKEENAAKDIKINELTNDLRNTKNENEELKMKLQHCDDWLKQTLKNMSPTARTEFKTAVQMAKNDFPVGTILRLRDNTGINFSKHPAPTNVEESPLNKSVVAFAVENSCEVPDMRATKKGLRYFYSYKYVLWMHFKSSESSDISYSQFCRYWPNNIVKPKIEDFGSCKCQTCENVELLVSGLKRSGYLSRDHEVEIMIKDTRDGDDGYEKLFKEELENLKTGENKDKPVSFLQWEKVNKSGKTGTKRDVVQRVQKILSCQEAVKNMEEKYENLKKHLDRNFTIKKTLKEKREMVMDSDDMAYVHMDWAENIEIKIPGEIQSAYFSHTNVSIHTGYLYSRKDSGGFVSLSDENNHKAESIHAALKPTIDKLVETGIKHIICVSDSPTSQYRNNKNVHLTKELAMKHNILIEWIFTEAGHGKSCCDGIGGNIKNLIRDLTAFNTSQVITNASDILQLIADKTTIVLSHHTQEDIDAVLKTLPRLGSLKGANKIHYLNFDSSGNVKAKGLPTDPIFDLVKLKILRNKPNRTTEEAPDENDDEI